MISSQLRKMGDGTAQPCGYQTPQSSLVLRCNIIERIYGCSIAEVPWLAGKPTGCVPRAAPATLRASGGPLKQLTPRTIEAIKSWGTTVQREPRTAPKRSRSGG